MEVIIFLTSMNRKRIGLQKSIIWLLGQKKKNGKVENLLKSENAAMPKAIIRSYEKYPFFVQKTLDAEKVIAKVGLPNAIKKN